MEYIQMTLDDWVEVKRRLQAELVGIKHSFVRIGYILRKIDDQKLYERDGYKTLAEFALTEYGLEATTVSRFMAINREFSIDGYSEQLRPEYEALGRSQLEEMLKLPEADRTMIQPETSRQSIRDLKTFNKAEPAAGAETEIGEVIRKFYEDNPDVCNAVLSELDAGAANAEDTKWLSELVNPGGNRHYRKGVIFLMMYENRIAVKKFGQEPEDMSWAEFYRITGDLYQAGLIGKTPEETKEEQETVLQEVTGEPEGSEEVIPAGQQGEEGTSRAEQNREEEIAPAQFSPEIPNENSDPELEEAGPEQPEAAKNEAEFAQKSGQQEEETDCKDAQDAEEALPEEAPEPEKPAKSPNKDSNSQEWKYQVRRCLSNLRVETDQAAWKAALASAKNLQHYLELLVRGGCRQDRSERCMEYVLSRSGGR